MPKICLNMIIKDESDHILECLELARPHIDCIAIIDTGSTDGTIEIVLDWVREHNISGKVMKGEFQNFEQARNDALIFAKQIMDVGNLIPDDYILFLNARTKLIQFDKSQLTAGVHLIEEEYGSIKYQNIRLVRAKNAIRWVGVTHEYLEASAPGEVLKNSKIINDQVGRDFTAKLQRDIKLLGAALIVNPNDSRAKFYLANTFYDLGRYNLALDLYIKRQSMGGFYEEVWYSKYREALCMWHLNYCVPHIAIKFWEAYVMIPHRIEPIAQLYRMIQCNTPYPVTDKLFIEHTLYPPPQ